MKETKEDIRQLGQLLEQSIERAGPFLRQSFRMLKHLLSAIQLVHHFQGIRTVVLATTTSQAEPRVAPVGAMLIRGSFNIPTVMTAARTKQILKQPAVSLTSYEGEEFALIIHGYAKIISPHQPEFALLNTVQQELTGGSVKDWGEGIYLQIQADRLLTFARFPEKFPG